jgi:hypothetical protein
VEECEAVCEQIDECNYITFYLVEGGYLRDGSTFHGMRCRLSENCTTGNTNFPPTAVYARPEKRAGGREVETQEVADLDEAASSTSRLPLHAKPSKHVASHIAHSLHAKPSNTTSPHVDHSKKVTFRWYGPFYPGYICSSGIGGVDDAFAGNFATSLAYCKILCEKEPRCVYVSYYGNPAWNVDSREGPPSRCRLSETCHVREKTAHGPTEIFAKEVIESSAPDVNDSSGKSAKQEDMAQTLGVLFLIALVVGIIAGLSLMTDERDEGQPSTSDDVDGPVAENGGAGGDGADGAGGATDSAQATSDGGK